MSRFIKASPMFVCFVVGERLKQLDRRQSHTD
jgi:hypothetical protein